MFRIIVVAALGALLPALALAASPVAGGTALDSYLSGLKTLRADFTQTVTDAKGNQVQRANGHLVIQRPGKFRWELTPVSAAGSQQSPQLMVADGKNLWFYDRDLEQVSVKPAAAALTATPASLLSGDGNLTGFFDVKADKEHDGLAWVRVRPRRNDADFREVQIGFKGNELQRMVLMDKLGQTVHLDFQSSVRNAPVPAEEVSFKPPPGADVIGTPVP